MRSAPVEREVALVASAWAVPAAMVHTRERAVWVALVDFSGAEVAWAVPAERESRRAVPAEAVAQAVPRVPWPGLALAAGAAAAVPVAPVTARLPAVRAGRVDRAERPRPSTAMAVAAVLVAAEA
jgi:hypothetical protein